MAPHSPALAALARALFRRVFTHDPVSAASRFSRTAPSAPSPSPSATLAPLLERWGVKMGGGCVRSMDMEWIARSVIEVRLRYLSRGAGPRKVAEEVAALLRQVGPQRMGCFDCCGLLNSRLQPQPKPGYSFIIGRRNFSSDSHNTKRKALMSVRRNFSSEDPMKLTNEVPRKVGENKLANEVPRKFGENDPLFLSAAEEFIILNREFFARTWGKMNIGEKTVFIQMVVVAVSTVGSFIISQGTKWHQAQVAEKVRQDREMLFKVDPVSMYSTQIDVVDMKRQLTQYDKDLKEMKKKVVSNEKAIMSFESIVETILAEVAKREPKAKPEFGGKEEVTKAAPGKNGTAD